MFELRLIDDKYELEDIAISCINCKKETGLYLRTSTFEEMIIFFVRAYYPRHTHMMQYCI